MLHLRNSAPPPLISGSPHPHPLSPSSPRDIAAAGGMGFHNRTISLIPDIAAAMDRRAKRFINRNINFAPTAHPRLTTVGRQVIAVEITAPTDVDLQLGSLYH